MAVLKGREVFITQAQIQRDVRMDVPGILEKCRIGLLAQFAAHVAIKDKAVGAGIGNAGEKILQGSGSGESAFAIEVDQASTGREIAEVWPRKQRFAAKLESMLAAKKRNMVHNVVVVGRTIGLGQILISADLREAGH